MKLSVLISAAALTTAVTLPAFAQELPPGPPSPPNAQMRQQFETNRKQMEQIHSQERTQVLDALSPEHKALLASIAGQLATSTSPDYRAAAQRLDAALSPPEKQAILNASQTARDKMRAQMDSMRQQMSKIGPSPGGSGSPGRPPMAMGMGGPPDGAQNTPTAGDVLLRVAMGGGGMVMRVQGSMRIDHP